MNQSTLDALRSIARAQMSLCGWISSTQGQQLAQSVDKACAALLTALDSEVPTPAPITKPK